ncbi:membrane protein FxsA [bacterium]|nr:membrane protein FxsA [bacterium]
MLFKLFLLFTIVPLIELTLLIKVGTYIGVLPTIIIVVLTGISGAALAKYEGLSVFNQIRTTLSEADIPGDEMLDGLLILVGGALLLTPGFLTDILGFTMIIPFTRRISREYLKRYFKNKILYRDIHIDVNR